MKQIKVPVWRFYLAGFLALWAGQAAVSFARIVHADGHKVWNTIAETGMVAAILTFVIYSIHKKDGPK